MENYTDAEYLEAVMGPKHMSLQVDTINKESKRAIERWRETERERKREKKRRKRERVRRVIL